MFSILREQLRRTRVILRGFTGNARGSLLVEPMWGIPFHLYTPYMSLYMIALGCSQTQIGLITSVGLVLQMVFSFLGGYITDRLGRRKTTLIFDIISWSIPTLLWAFAQNYHYFLIAAALNSIVRIVFTSWTCLIVEDTTQDQRVHVFTWIHVAGTIAGFFAPFAGLLVEGVGLVPATRGLYIFAFFSMTSMFFLRNHLTRETSMGRRKIEEGKGLKLQDTLKEYKGILRDMLKNRQLLVAFFMLIFSNIQMVVKRTFLSILLKNAVEVPLGIIAVIPAAASVAMLFIYVFVMPSLGNLQPKVALLIGLMISSFGVVMLVVAPAGSLFLAFAGSICEAAGMAIIIPVTETILTNAIEDHQRAKVTSLYHTILFGFMSPFGYLSGYLSSISVRFPFFMVLGTLVVRILLLPIVRQKQRP